jgi:hypothetical protein
MLAVKPTAIWWHHPKEITEAEVPLVISKD